MQINKTQFDLFAQKEQFDLRHVLKINEQYCRR